MSAEAKGATIAEHHVKGRTAALAPAEVAEGHAALRQHHDVHGEDPELPPPMDGEAGVAVKVEDPLAHSVDFDVEGVDAGNVDREQAALDAGEEAAAAAMEAAAAAEAAEACLGNVLDDVAGVVDVHHPHEIHPDVGAPGDHHEHAPPHHEEHVPVATEIVVGHHEQQHEAEGVSHDDVGGAEDDEVALAAAAAAAAVQAADGMAVVVDQALLATAAAAAASQVAEVLAEQQPPPAHHGVPQDAVAPPPLPQVVAAATQQMLADRPHGADLAGSEHDRGDLLEQRRQKDRKRYSAMTPEARASYNAHRRELYHKQGEAARKRRRERERDRYHSLEGESKKQRNERRAKLERDRYNRLSKEELAARNARRRERAKQRKLQAKTAVVQVPPEDATTVAATATIPPPPRPEGAIVATKVAVGGDRAPATSLPDGAGDADVAGAPLPEATVDVADAREMADASALAAEVAEQVIAGTNLEGAMDAVSSGPPPAAEHEVGEDEEGPTVQI